MPRYRYECTQCGDLIIVFHSFKETFSDCEKCEQKGTMQKLLSTPITIKKQTIDISNKKIGELTKEYIEENRKVLKQQKEEARKKSYESS
jgi:putative FmdB family regulatory protein